MVRLFFATSIEIYSASAFLFIFSYRAGVTRNISTAESPDSWLQCHDTQIFKMIFRLIKSIINTFLLSIGTTTILLWVWLAIKGGDLEEELSIPSLLLNTVSTTFLLGLASLTSLFLVNKDIYTNSVSRLLLYFIGPITVCFGIFIFFQSSVLSSVSDITSSVIFLFFYSINYRRLITTPRSTSKLST